MKTCTLCKTEKPIIEFGVMSRAPDGRQSRCKPCLREKGKDYYGRNKEKMNADSKRYRENNKDRVNSYLKEWNANNKEYVSADRKKYYAENNALIKAKRAEARKLNAPKRAADNRKWKAANREKVNSNNRAYVRQKYRSDPLFALAMTCRRRLLQAFAKKGFSKGSSTEQLLGCDMATLREHLEKNFLQDMTWENRGFYGWHVDHILPLASAKTVEELESLCQYTNLQPLWAADNIAKSDKILHR